MVVELQELNTNSGRTRTLVISVVIVFMLPKYWLTVVANGRSMFESKELRLVLFFFS